MYCTNPSKRSVFIPSEAYPQSGIVFFSYAKAMHGEHPRRHSLLLPHVPQSSLVYYPIYATGVYMRLAYVSPARFRCRNAEHLLSTTCFMQQPLAVVSSSSVQSADLRSDVYVLQLYGFIMPGLPIPEVARSAAGQLRHVCRTSFSSLLWRPQQWLADCSLTFRDARDIG